MVHTCVHACRYNATRLPRARCNLSILDHPAGSEVETFNCPECAECGDVPGVGDRDRANNFRLLNRVNVVPRVRHTRLAALSPTIVSRCGNYIPLLLLLRSVRACVRACSRSRSLVCMCSYACVRACSFTGLDVFFFFPRFARCPCIGVYTTHVIDACACVIRAPLCIFHGCTCAAGTCVSSCGACDSVCVRTVHAIGIYENHANFLLSSPLVQEKIREYGYYVRTHVPSWLAFTRNAHGVIFSYVVPLWKPLQFFSTLF